MNRSRHIRHLLCLSAVLLSVAISLTSALAADKTWANTGTDYNDGLNWTGGLPGTGDAALFSSAVTNQPILSGAIQNQQIRFTTSTGGWLLSGTPALTLNSTGTGTTAGTGSAIVSSNTSGTNTISAPIILGQANATTATFYQAAGGTLNLSGNISSTSAINGISLATTSGIFTLSGTNTYTGNTTVSNATMILNLNSASSLSTGALVLGASTTIDNTSGAPITLANNNINLSSGSLTYSGSNDLSFGSGVANLSTANRTITTNGAGVLTIGSIDTDTTVRTLTKAGAGTLRITSAAGANFQGGTTLNGGILQVGDNAALGTGNITFTSGTLEAVNSDVTLSNVSFLTALTVSGSQNLTLSGNFTNSGGNRVLINTMATGKSLTLSGTVFLQDPTSAVGRQLTFAGNGTTLVSGQIVNGGTAGNGPIVVSSTGLTIFTGNNSYTGSTTINAGGTLQIGNNGTTGSIDNTSSVTGSGSLVFDRTDNFVFSRTISSAISVTQQGGGSLTLSSGSSVFTGGLFVTSGKVVAGSALGLGRGQITLANDTEVDLNGFSQAIGGFLSSSGNGSGALVTTRVAGGVTLSLGQYAPADAGSGTYAGLITNGNGTVGIIKGGSGIQTLTGANSYNGTTRIDGGVLAVNSLANGGVNSSIGASSNATGNLVLNGGTLRYIGTGGSTDRLFTFNGASGGILDASGTGAINFTSTGTYAMSGANTARTFTLTGNNTDANTLAGIVANAGTTTGITSLTKAGVGKWVFTGNNTYSGQTQVNAGTLLINGTHIDGTTTGTATGFGNSTTGHFQVADQATLGGTGRISGNDKGAADSNLVLVKSGGVLAPGASIGTLTLDGVSINGTASRVLNMDLGAEFTFELAGNGTSADQLNFWNYVTNDLELNTNAINLSLLGTETPGNYNVDIINFFSNNGTTGIAHGFGSGNMTIGTLGPNISGATIDWNGVNNLGQSIALNYTVIPEPGTALMFGFGLTVLLYGFRRRKT